MDTGALGNNQGKTHRELSKSIINLHSFMILIKNIVVHGLKGAPSLLPFVRSVVSEFAICALFETVFSKACTAGMEKWPSCRSLIYCKGLGFPKDLSKEPFMFEFGSL